MTHSSKAEPTFASEIGCLFIDSGAHSIYNEYAHNKPDNEKWAFYKSKQFWSYVDDYIEFLKKYQTSIDLFVNVDVIHNPELTWEVQLYMEENGVHPVPVVHQGTDVEWLKKYLRRGYDLVALGGVALNSSFANYSQWADRMFNYICDQPSKLPKVRVHGFAMTSYVTMVRYPWWSVDSSSWAKAGGFGSIYVPRTVKGVYNFTLEPYVVAISADSPQIKHKGKHYQTLSPSRGVDGVAAGYIQKWLEQIGVPLGSVGKEPVTTTRNKVKYPMEEWGVTSHYQARKIANLKFFEAVSASLPAWPWPFTAATREGFFE